MYKPLRILTLLAFVAACLAVGSPAAGGLLGGPSSAAAEEPLPPLPEPISPVITDEPGRPDETENLQGESAPPSAVEAVEGQPAAGVVGLELLNDADVKISTDVEIAGLTAAPEEPGAGQTSPGAAMAAMTGGSRMERDGSWRNPGAVAALDLETPASGPARVFWWFVFLTPVVVTLGYAVVVLARTYRQHLDP